MRSLVATSQAAVKAQPDLKAAILGALEAVDGQAYLEAVAKSDPRTFCTLLGRAWLPMTIAGDPSTIQSSYEVTPA